VEEVAVQLAAGESSGLDELRQPQSGASAGCMRRQERVVSRPLDDHVEGAAGLRLGRDRLVANGARGQLDPVPREDVRGDELGERVEYASAQFGLRRGLDHPAGEPVCGAHVCVGEPGHGVTANILLSSIREGNPPDVHPPRGPSRRRCAEGDADGAFAGIVGHVRAPAADLIRASLPRADAPEPTPPMALLAAGGRRGP
jgi:hypothetical protein